nr:cytokinin riboside 5'-monophosphate phosphoribohydrolase LOG7 [Ipomoea batatas]
MEAEKRSRFQRICVFCGSSPGKKPSYQEAAIELGKVLVERRIDFGVWRWKRGSDGSCFLRQFMNGGRMF